MASFEESFEGLNLNFSPLLQGQIGLSFRKHPYISLIIVPEIHNVKTVYLLLVKGWDQEVMKHLYVHLCVRLPVCSSCFYIKLYVSFICEDILKYIQTVFVYESMSIRNFCLSLKKKMAATSYVNVK